MRKEQLKELCDSGTKLPLFMQYHWLEAVKERGEWDVAIVEKGGEVFGIMPYFIRKRFGFTFIQNPPLTPYLGIWIQHPPGQKENTRLSFEKEIVSELVQQLPRFSSYRVKYLPGKVNLLPLFWSGFKLFYRCTYVINNPGSLNDLLTNADQQIRRQVKKAESQLIVSEGSDVDELIKMKLHAYQSNAQEFPYNVEIVRKIYNQCSLRSCVKLLYAREGAGKSHAGMMIVWDDSSCYYLLGASNPDFKNSGAMSLLMVHAIQEAASMGKVFNFEGSMIESIERFFRNFGAEQLPYTEVVKVNSVYLRLKEAFT